MGVSQSGPPIQADWKDEANARWTAQRMHMPQNYPMDIGGRGRGTDDFAGAAGMASGGTGPSSEMPSTGHSLFGGGGGGGGGGDAARSGSQSAAMAGGEFQSQGGHSSNAQSQGGGQAPSFPSMGMGMGSQSQMGGRFEFSQQQMPGPYGSIWVGRHRGADIYRMPSRRSNRRGGGGFQDDTGYWDG